LRFEWIGFKWDGFNYFIDELTLSLTLYPYGYIIQFINIHPTTELHA